MQNSKVAIESSADVLDTKTAANVLIREIDAFKRRRRYHRFIQLKPVAPLLLSGKKMKETFYKLAEQLETLRVLVFGLNPVKFYRLASEFIVSSNNVKFYPVRHVFGEGDLQDEYLERVEGTLTWICDVCEDDETEKPSVIDFINVLKGRVKVFDTTIDYKSKEWYCVKSIARFGDIKGWAEDEFLGKLKNFYAARRKKVTAEMMLADLARGDLDVTPVSKAEEKEKAKKPKVAKLVKISEIRE